MSISNTDVWLGCVHKLLILPEHLSCLSWHSRGNQLTDVCTSQLPSVTSWRLRMSVKMLLLVHSSDMLIFIEKYQTLKLVKGDFCQ